MSANQRGPENADASVAALFAVDPTAVKIGKEIGKGAFSVVYSGEYNKKHVAVKCQPKDEEGNIPQFVLKEVQILQKLRHPNILEFIGAADNRKTRQILILSEHSSHGDLDQLLKNIRQEKVKHVGWQKVTEMALDVARGVAFLHASGMIHRDIKSSNILLDDRMRAKLCDFGFATETKWWYETSSTGEQPETSGVVRRKSYCGTDAYMAPEMFLDEDYDETVDVFSFGVVLMELLCCRQANKDGFLMRLPQHKFKIQENEFRDALPASCPAVLSDLAEQCVSFEPSERPKSVDVVKVLTEAISSKDRCDKFEKVIELRPFTPTTSLDLAEGEPQLEDDDEDDDDEEEEDEDFRDDDSGADTMELDEEEDAQEHPPVVPPPRHSGPLLKRNRRGNRGWSEKMFIIDQDYLHYTDIPKERNTGSNGRRLSQPSPPTMSSLYLKDCRIWKTMEMPELCFNILNGSWKIKRELRALNLDDLEKWMILINQAIDFANDQALSRQSASKPLHAKGKAHNNGSSGSRERGGSRGSRGKTKHAEERRPEALTKKQVDDAEDTYEDLNDEVYQWLRELGLQRYTGTLKTKGFSSLDFIRETGIEKEDLNFLGIKDSSARRILTDAARSLRGEDA